MNRQVDSNFFKFAVNCFWPGLLWILISITITWGIRNWFPFNWLFWIRNGWVYMRWIIGTSYLAWVIGLGSFVVFDTNKRSVQTIVLAVFGFLIATVSMRIWGGKVSWVWITLCAGLQVIPFAVRGKRWAGRSQLLVNITNWVLTAVGWLIITGTGW